MCSNTQVDVCDARASAPVPNPVKDLNMSSPHRALVSPSVALLGLPAQHGEVSWPGLACCHGQPLRRAWRVLLAHARVCFSGKVLVTSVDPKDEQPAGPHPWGML